MHDNEHTDLEALEVPKAIIRPVIPHISIVSWSIFISPYGITPPECIGQLDSLHVAPTCALKQEFKLKNH